MFKAGFSVAVNLHNKLSHQRPSCAVAVVSAMVVLQPARIDQQNELRVRTTAKRRTPMSEWTSASATVSSSSTGQ